MDKKNHVLECIQNRNYIDNVYLIYIFGILITTHGLIISIVALGTIEILGALVIGISFYLPSKWKSFIQIQPILLENQTPCCV